MRTLITIAAVFLLAPVALGQASSVPNTEGEVKEALRKLFSELNEAIYKRDRAALERVYADEFQFVHSTGGVVNKAAQINGIMSNDPVSSAPVPTPSFDQLLVYGDVAILRTSGRWVAGTNIYARKGGRWQIVQVQGTRLPPERRPVQLDPKALDAFLGKYEFAPGAYATVTKEGDALKWQAGGRPKVTLVPLSDNRFYARENDAEMTFSKGDKGQATDVVLRLGSCQESKAKKIE
jgi:hypothetical protein